MSTPSHSQASPVTRRRLLGWALAGPATITTSVAAAQLGRRAALLRPVASGTSASRCGQCGDADHTMLSAACPAAPHPW